MTEPFEDHDEIAIIGMAGRFPGASHVDALWENLRAGFESIRSFTREELAAAGVSAETLADPNFVNSGSLADDLDAFDAAFFGIGRREAEVMDPQHRVMLETAWEALERAGYDPLRYAGRIGVFGGVAPNTYRQEVLSRDPGLLAKVGHYLSMISSEREYAITRIAFKLQLRGPAISVNTACSSSGVALHLACQSLLSGESDMCLVGGARVKAPLGAGYVYQEDGIPSPDGHCRAFDADARGTAIGSGVSMVVLKRVADAVRDGDWIHALVRGTAVNNDGSAKAGFTAPSVQGQSAVVAEALAVAGVDADQVQYVEAHGTGTALGDPIEVAALTKAFRETTERSGYCALGSLKTNIGHLDAGAGVAGVIKAALALEHAEIPPSLHFEKPNPQIDFASSPFFVNAELRPWPESGGPRRAGVSSFGLGGTNFHAVLEEAPEIESSGPSRDHQLLLLSARSADALDEATRRLGASLEARPEQPLADVAYTLQHGRRRFPFRRALVAGDRSDAALALDALDRKRLETREDAEEGRPVAFLFPGGGAQYPGMGRDLYRSEVVFREAIDRCATILQPELGRDLRELLYPADGAEAAETERPSLALPLLFSVEYALAQLWQDWGLQPAAMLGHSMGEYAAACLAGVVTLEQGLGLVSLRGRLFETLPEGGMLSVPLGADEARAIAGDALDFAAINRPDSCVLSGPVEAIEAVQVRLEAREIPSTRIHISVAAHSRLVEPILEEFEAHLRGLELRAPEIPYVSNVTGTWIRPEEACDPGYWVQHLRQTVRFSLGLETLLGEGAQILLEAGPGQTLSTFARQHPARDAGHVVVPSLRHPREVTADDAFLLGSLGRLWLAGAEVDWQRFHARERRRRVPLPTYPFERVRYWADTQSPAESPLAVPQALTPRTVPAEIEVPVMSEPAAPAVPRKDRILPELVEIVQDLTGLDEAEIDVHASFLELGLDSLMLTQASTAFQRAFDIKITFRQLFEEATDLDALAEYIDAQLPAEALAAAEVPAPAPVPAPAAASAQPAALAVAPAAMPVASTELPADASLAERVIQQQLDLMQQQLAVLRGQGVAAPAPAAPAPQAQAAPAEEVATPAPATAAKVATPGPEKKGLGPWKPVEKGPTGGLTERQQSHLDALITRFNAKTAESKRLTQKHRAHLSDPRTVAGFRQQWKELIYPIWSDRSKGSKLWDVDGNEWLDITMGFGVTLFGHSPDFIVDAIADQLGKTMAIGPQTVQVGEAAELLCELTGMERAAFCNTGSEAVLAAIRTARTVTGRDRIVTFGNDYHGIFDEVLVKGVKVKGEVRPQPVAPGIPRAAVSNVSVLDYGEDASLDAIRGLAGELAAVVVEPVQSRNPGLQPGEFLRKLRTLTEELDIPLIFDEMITGFRLHAGGAQHHFGVKADVACYGKVIGGGMPIGVVAGSARYLDALDAGGWSFGDDSAPEAGVTWFAGTFVRHPLSIAAALAALRKLKEAGPSLQENVNAKVSHFAETLNAWYDENQYPMRITHFSSLFLVDMEGDQDYAGLYWHHLRDLGIHTHERRPNFLTAAHSDEDMERLAEAFREAARRMRSGGFLPLPRGAERRPWTEAWEAPATEEQIELWLACQMGHDATCAFNLSYSMHFRGDFDLEAMRKALQGLVDRHDSLRMTFLETGDTLRFQPRLELEVPFSDWSDRDAAAGEAGVQEWIEDELEREYDLENGPVVRARIAKLASDHHYVLFGVHHVASDGFSAGILIRELAALYNAARAGREPELAAAMQYSEYAEWQEEERHTAAFEEAGVWWRQHLSEPCLPPPLELPTDRARPRTKTFVSAPLLASLSAELCGDLKRSGQERRCTMFSTLLGGFALFLHRLTGQDDLVVGIPASGQSMVGSQDLVGHCAHHHPLRSRIEWGEPLRDYLARIQGSVLDAYEHRNYTEGTILRSLSLPRDPSRLALINVQFNMDPAPLVAGFEGLESDVFFNGRHYNAPDITFNLVEDHEGAVQIRCEYNTDLFDEATLGRWLANFDRTLRAIAEDPDRSVDEVPVVCDAERNRILNEWNDTGQDHDRTATLRSLFEAQATRTPDAEAIVGGGVRLTYRELDARANLLGERLIERGVEHGDLVALCMNRGVDLVIGVLGIHKAGAAYVPVDPSYPEERIGFILEDARARAIVTESSLRDRWDGQDVTLVCVDKLEGESPNRPETQVAPEDLAYVIYTSGSTGRPKGVAIEHRSPAALLAWARTVYTPAELSGVLFATSVCFDLSVYEMFVALTTGGKLIVSENALGLASHPQASEVTLINTVPSAATELVELGAIPASVRTVNLAGEPLTTALVDRLYQVETIERVYDLYGPSEDTTYSTWALREAGAPATIGRPVANTSAYLLDPRGQLLPSGIPGELFLAGEGLARGYLHRPDLTAERFVPDPFSEDPGARMYRTGDLVRQRQDGTLEYLGRIDHQVKVRGYRIELGEIEAVLDAHPAVERCVVVVLPDPQGDPRLVAYWSPAAGASADLDELRGHLRTKLPEYMVPSVILELAALPQTPNGKIDRKQLPDPNPKANEPESVPAPAPEPTTLEGEVSALWCEFLGVDQVGPREEFFDLGGHSLLGVRLVRAMNAHFGVSLAPLVLFEHPTVAELAIEVERNGGRPKGGGPEASPAPVEREEVEF